MAATVAVSALPRPPRLHPAPVTMASAAAVSALSMPPRLHYPTAAVASPIRAVISGHRHPTRAFNLNAVLRRDDTVEVPIQAIGPANDNSSIFKLTLDLSNAEDEERMYTTPGQYVRVSVPSFGGSASMEFASAPRSGLHQYDLLVRSVPGTIAERLCKLAPGDQVELGPVIGPGFPVEEIEKVETVLYFAVAEGLSPIRALITSGYTKNVKLYYGARNKESVPLQGEINEWNVNKEVLTDRPVQYPFLEDPGPIDPNSTVAVLVGPIDMQQEVKRALTGLGVPGCKIITVPGWYPNY
ncbi:unnamed protein product [Urochloa decumbens]|uniref:FAD-binding FR-type domain-containing protein n=1 Tax=Urochloa decumbens TaxID=240449 RepID=A0ABC9DAP0_9POAL